MAIEIRKVRTESEACAIFRLRYEVYIQELDRVQHRADHARGLIEESFDADANLFAAYDGTRVVGTVRTNYAHRSQLREYEQLYEMAKVGTAHPHSTSITTKLVVKAEHRGSALAYRLAAATYEQALRDGILFDFIDVYPPRVPFFERLGYRVHLASALHSEYGDVVVMRLAMRDAAHLQKVRSPFLRYLLRTAPEAA